MKLLFTFKHYETNLTCRFTAPSYAKASEMISPTWRLHSIDKVYDPK